MKVEKLTMFGAVFAAFAASLCCILPLVFVVLGVGAFSAATVFETARPYLLGVAALLLTFGFYRAYFQRKEACAPDEACATKPINKAGRIGLWLASSAVMAFALSPYYAGTLANVLTRKTAAPEAQSQTAIGRATFKVSGMTCAGCETTIKTALEQTPGVRRAEVSYDRSEAVVEYNANATTPEKLRDAINQTGYTVESVK